MTKWMIVAGILSLVLLVGSLTVAAYSLPGAIEEVIRAWQAGKSPPEPP